MGPFRYIKHLLLTYYHKPPEQIEGVKDLWREVTNHPGLLDNPEWRSNFERVVLEKTGVDLRHDLNYRRFFTRFTPTAGSFLQALLQRASQPREVPLSQLAELGLALVEWMAIHPEADRLSLFELGFPQLEAAARELRPGMHLRDFDPSYLLQLSAAEYYSSLLHQGRFADAAELRSTVGFDFLQAGIDGLHEIALQADDAHALELGVPSLVNHDFATRYGVELLLQHLGEGTVSFFGFAELRQQAHAEIEGFPGAPTAVLDLLAMFSAYEQFYERGDLVRVQQIQSWLGVEQLQMASLLYHHQLMEPSTIAGEVFLVPPSEDAEFQVTFQRSAANELPDFARVALHYMHVVEEMLVPYQRAQAYVRTIPAEISSYMAPRLNELLLNQPAVRAMASEALSVYRTYHPDETGLGSFARVMWVLEQAAQWFEARGDFEEALTMREHIQAQMPEPEQVQVEETPVGDEPPAEIPSGTEVQAPDADYLDGVRAEVRRPNPPSPVQLELPLSPEGFEALPAEEWPTSIESIPHPHEIDLGMVPPYEPDSVAQEIAAQPITYITNYEQFYPRPESDLYAQSSSLNFSQQVFGVPGVAPVMMMGAAPLTINAGVNVFAPSPALVW